MPDFSVATTNTSAGIVHRRQTSLRVIVIEDETPEPGGAKGPCAFDDLLVKWAIRQAGTVTLWACATDPHVLRKAASILAEPGKNVVVMSNLDNEFAWMRVAGAWAPKGAATHAFVTRGSDSASQTKRSEAWMENDDPDLWPLAEAMREIFDSSPGLRESFDELIRNLIAEGH